jgi:predicted Zn-dependent protease
LVFVLGWSLAAAGDDRSAVTAWRGGVLMNPKVIPPYLALADAYVRLGQPMLARQVLKSGLETVPDSPELQERLAQLQQR